MFFFSSRRRHTRFSRDWSSDVCSSDLHQFRHAHLAHHKFTMLHVKDESFAPLTTAQYEALPAAARPIYRISRNVWPGLLFHIYRSEERRVGKECRSWWPWYD